MTTHSEPQVEHNKAHHRYEIIIDDQRSMIQYQMRGDTIIFVHTEVPPALEGRGIAGRMARFALDDARTHGLKVVPRCPYIANYIKKHPEYQDLVAHTA